MRILWLSNSPLGPSGYGGQSALAGKALKALGHDVAFAANYGQYGVLYEDMPIFDCFGDSGNSKVGVWADKWEADKVICLYDSWVMRPDDWPEEMGQVAIWAPIDEWPIPPKVLGVLMHERVKPIAMSRFGEAWMKKFELEPLYVPHAVDTKVFHPLDRGKEESVSALGQGLIPKDAFLVGMVAANRGWSQHGARKSFPQAFAAFSRFARRHPDAYLYVHTEINPGNPGIDLNKLAIACGIKDRVLMPLDDMWTLGVMGQEFLVGAYNAFDVLLNPSMSEGFGIPIIEAQACGVPVIVSDHSSMPELVGSGCMVEGDPWWDGHQEAWAHMPFIASIEQALENEYNDRGNVKRKERAVAFAQGYDADTVRDTYWKPALDELLTPRKESRQVRRARERKAVKA